MHDQAAIPPLVSLYTLINKMRAVFNPGIVERADKVLRMIIDTYDLPNRTVPELHAMVERGRKPTGKAAPRSTNLAKTAGGPT